LKINFFVRAHPNPCLILIRAQIRALLFASKSKFIRAQTLTLLVFDKKNGLGATAMKGRIKRWTPRTHNSKKSAIRLSCFFLSLSHFLSLSLSLSLFLSFSLCLSLLGRFLHPNNGFNYFLSLFVSILPIRLRGLVVVFAFGLTAKLSPKVPKA
jgi:hypothetical protein